MAQTGFIQSPDRTEFLLGFLKSKKVFFWQTQIIGDEQDQKPKGVHTLHISTFNQQSWQMVWFAPKIQV